MSRLPGFLCLSDEQLAGLGLTTVEIVQSIENAVLAEQAGALWTAPKASLLPGDGRYMMATLAAAEDPKITAVKSVTVSPRNPERGLSGINGAIMLLDSETGLLRAVLGANWVTAVRTAGLSAAVARRLANPASQSVAFIGCGVQARSHLDAFADLFPLNEVRAFGRGQANVERLCAAAREKGLAAHRSTSAQEALADVDLVVSSVTLDYDLTPFLDARWLKPGAFAAITDLAIPWAPEGMSAFGTVVIDDEEQEAASARPMVRSDIVDGDLTKLVTGELNAQFSPAKRSAFIFRGIAVGDFAVASLAYKRATELGIGMAVDW